MNKKCSVCGLVFEPEPGFYYGAMYISYAPSVAVAILSGFVLYNFFGDPDMWVYFLTALGMMMVITPISFRLSRSLMLHLFGGVKYDQKYHVENT